MKESERKAFELYKDASEKSNADAMMELANFYISGAGVIGDRVKGRELMGKSASEGSAEAKAIL